MLYLNGLVNFSTNSIGTRCTSIFRKVLRNPDHVLHRLLPTVTVILSNLVYMTAD